MPGTIRQISDPAEEMARLALQRQISAGQVCPAADRACDADCERGAAHCLGWHLPRRSRAHDPAHCDRAWAAGSTP
jgi:hypothetical protein